MKKVKILVSAIFLVFALVSVASAQQNQNQNQSQIMNQGENQALQNQNQIQEQESLQDGSDNMTQDREMRQIKMRNVSSEMNQIAERNQGAEQQIRAMAQNQEQNQENIEQCLEKAQERSGFAKFFIGPNYGQLKTAEERLEQHNQNLEELKQLKSQLINQGDVQQLEEQIRAMEQIAQEIEDDIDQEKKGFSLFGWLFRMFN